MKSGREIVAALVFTSVLLILCMIVGCGMEMRVMTHTQYQNLTKNRVLINHGFGERDQFGFIPNQYNPDKGGGVHD